MASIPVLNPLFGTLAMIHVEEGAFVEEGEELGEIEAMKTFNHFMAPASGIVHWCAELGEVLGEGELLAEIVT